MTARKQRRRRAKYLDILDPIHGYVRVFDREVAIVDHPLFQRLRRIRQLSGAHLTYPSAQHTRFEHSLGTMHVASQAGHMLMEKGMMNADQVELLRLAALLHDVGHGPFSHLFEEVLQQHIHTSHEEFGKRIILESEIGDILSQYGYDKKVIVGIAFGTSRYPYMNQIISGALSADMMDYLRRDSYFTGAQMGRTEYQRIIQSFVVHKKELAVEHSALYSFESMMHARYQMFKAVYFHRSVRAAEVMLLEALRISDDVLGFTTFDLAKMPNLTDEPVLSAIVTTDIAEISRAKSLATDYQNRNLLKCVFENIVTSRKKLQRIIPGRLRRTIADAARVPEDEIFVDSSATPSLPLAPSKSESSHILVVDPPPAAKSMRVAPLSISTSGDDDDGDGAQRMPISCIPSVHAISGFMNILRVYTTSKHRNKVEIAMRAMSDDLT